MDAQTTALCRAWPRLSWPHHHVDLAPLGAAAACCGDAHQEKAPDAANVGGPVRTETQPSFSSNPPMTVKRFATLRAPAWRRRATACPHCGRRWAGVLLGVTLGHGARAARPGGRGAFLDQVGVPMREAADNFRVAIPQPALGHHPELIEPPAASTASARGPRQRNAGWLPTVRGWPGRGLRRLPQRHVVGVDRPAARAMTPADRRRDMARRLAQTKGAARRPAAPAAGRQRAAQRGAVSEDKAVTDGDPVSLYPRQRRLAGRPEHLHLRPPDLWG